MHPRSSEAREQGAARDRILLKLQQEGLEAYRRKVDQANRCRTQLRKAARPSL